jgi:DNA polymerase III subunit alpha, Gram-positive type
MDLLQLCERLNIKNPAIRSGSFDGIDVSVVSEQWSFRFTYPAVLELELIQQLQAALRLVYEKYQPVVSITYANPLVPASLLKSYYDSLYQMTLKDVPRIEGLSVFEQSIDSHIRFFVKTETDKALVEKYVKSITATAKQWFVELPIVVEINANGVSTEELIEEEKLQSQIQAEEAATKAKQDRLYATGPVEGKWMAISDIPATEDEVKELKNGNYLFEGNIFSVDKRVTQRGAIIYDAFITDDVDSIRCRAYHREESNASASILDDLLLVGKRIQVSGQIKVDRYSSDVYVEVEHVKNIASLEASTDVGEPRVEFHLHTKMSAMDGISDVTSYVAQAVAWGHPAIAVTDHNSVQAFPELAYATKHQPIKPIYGAELSFVDDVSISITTNEVHQELLQATFVVFDIETTGLSVRYDHMIELSAIKIVEGQIIEEYSTFVKTKQPLSAFTTTLTGITEQDLVGAPDIETVIKEFQTFRDGAILVAHNASFDLAHLYQIEKNLGLFDEEAPSVDTLNLSRVLYPELKAFNLKAISKHLKVELTQHHRAIHDTRATAQIILKQLQELYTRQIVFHDEMASLIGEDNVHKIAIPSHINLYATNRTGLTNLYKIVSTASTTHYFREPRALASVIETYREGLLISTACGSSNVMDAAINLNDETLLERLSFYDIVELQPYTHYLHLRKDDPSAEDHIKASMRSIIEAATTLGLPIIASSDAHYVSTKDRVFRDVYIDSPQLGGGVHPLKYVTDRPSQHFYSTNELKELFAWLSDDDIVQSMVVDAPLAVAEEIEEFDLFPTTLYTPSDDFFKSSGIDSINHQVETMVWAAAKAQYSKTLPSIVKTRVEDELSTIISRGFANVYYLSHVIVKESLDAGYLVGSRGSVGSSLVATLMNITEVNPLPPHYVCSGCGFSLFKEKDPAFDARTQLLHEHLQQVESGYDLPFANCPRCGNVLRGEGQDIPFATFLGFEGNKVPDIDLNFSGDYQAKAHEHIRQMFGEDKAFRAGTISTIQDRTAFGYVKKFFEERNVIKRGAEVQRFVNAIQGVKRSTGQHPGGIVVVPDSIDITHITPVQFPADDDGASWRTTHFDYHSFEQNLFKLDILGHDDPTTIKFLMDYVAMEPDEFPFTDVLDIPMNDKDVLALFSSTESLAIHKPIQTTVGTYGVPEFGTNFVRGILEETKPNSFSQLLKISGLSHGTDVWLNNAKTLVEGQSAYGLIPFTDVIGCRDDIMIYLMYQGVPAAQAYDIMETARRTGKFLSQDQKNTMINHGIPDWYIWSCDQIKYMFPKAHAAAYVMMALRIAWFKVHRPIYFYAAWFTIKANHVDIDVMSNGYERILKELETLKSVKNPTTKQQGLITSLEVALEMTARGYAFAPIDLMTSDAKAFVIGDDKRSIHFPFVSVDQLGEAAAVSIVEARSTAPFASLEDFKARTKVAKPQVQALMDLKVLAELQPEEDNQMSLF